MRMQLRMLFTVSCLLFFGLLARGQTPITVSGDPVVCKGDTATYWVTPTSGLTYLWSTSVEGNVGTSSGGSALVLWSGVGTGTVYAYGIDNTGDTVEAGSMNVLISPLPNPYLTSNSQVGCQQLDFDTAREREKPPVPPGINDNSGCILVCEHSTVTYYAHDLPGATYTWNVGGANWYTPMGDSCVVNWGPAGNGTISVTETNANGCKKTIQICVKIILRPAAVFNTQAVFSHNDNSTGNTISICRGDNVAFIDLSTGDVTSPIMSCYWNFGDGTIMTTPSPTTLNHVYNTPGNYTVTLVVTNACGCKDTARLRVRVSTRPGVNITCPSVVCEGATAGYKVHNYSGCGSFDWSVIGGTIISTMPYTDSIVVQWDNVDTSGFGYVIFDPSSCSAPCTAPTVVKVPVIQANGFISGPTVICPGKQYIYRMPQWPTTDFNWSIVSGTGATLSYTDQRNEIVINTVNSGPITLNVSYHNTLLGCGGTATLNITVEPPVTVNGPEKVCYNTTNNWTLSGGAIGDWVLTYPDNSQVTASGSNSFSGTFNQIGHYTLAVTGSFCGPDPLQFDVKALPPAPDSLLGPAVACAGIATKYTAKNAIPGTIFEWSVSSGSVNGVNGDYTYANFSGPAPYTISVWRITTDDPHCPSPAISRIIQSPVPNLTISGPDTVCGSTTQSYSVNYLNGETYNWTITPSYLGSVSTGAGGTNPGITWNNPLLPGGETAYLVVEMRKCFVTYRDTLKVFVQNAPVITVTGPDTVCSGTLASFTISSSPSLSSFGTVTWNFGDGTSVTGGYPGNSHYYNTTGASSPASFQPTVTITSPNGCLADATDFTTIWVRPAPVAYISPAGPIGICATTWSQNLVATVTSGFGTTTGYAWYKVGSGTLLGTSNSLNVTSSGTGMGFGTYYCIVTNSNGCSDTTNLVQLFNNCVTPCGPATNVPTLSVSVTLDSCGRLHAVGNWSPLAWGFNPTWTWPTTAFNVSSDPNNVYAQFPVAGSYSFTYYVRYINNAGDTCIITKTASGIVPYKAAMKHNISCSGSTYSLSLLDNSNFYPGTGGILTRDFYINNVLMQSSTTLMSYTTTAGPGTYYLREELYDNLGNPVCVAYDTVVLPNVPVASFTVSGFNPSCAGQSAVQFNNTSTFYSGNLWIFGELGSNNNLTNTSKVYSFSGTKTVNLIVKNIYGCSDTATGTVTVMPVNLGGTLSHAPMYPCQGDAVTLTYNPNMGTVLPSTYNWNNQDGYLLTGTSPTLVIYEPGGYWVYGTNSLGCWVKTNMDSVNITQVPHPVITGDTNQCYNTQFTLNGFAGNQPGLVYTWLRNNVVIATGTDYTLDQTLTAVGTYNYTLVVGVPNPGGGYCTDTSDIFKVTVHSLPPPPSTSFSMVDCNSYTVKLNATNMVSGIYNWSNGANGQTIQVNAGGPYRVWFTDVNGCVSHSDMYVPKDPRVYLWVFPAGCYEFCKNEMPKTILGPLQSTAWFSYWEWLKNGGVDLSGSGAVSDYTIYGPGTYNLMLNNGYCSATSNDMNVSVKSCKDCTDELYFKPAKVYTKHCEGADPDIICCRWFITIDFYNSFPFPIGVSMSATGGSMSPGGTVVNPGWNSVTFEYIPFSSSFSGGPITLTMTYTDPKGVTHICYRTIDLPPCGDKADGSKRMFEESDSDAMLHLVPNPASDMTRIDYQFSGSPEGSTIEVYDMMGRKAASQSLSDNKGSWQLSLQNFNSGMYIVVLKAHGNTVLQGKLTVTK